MTPKVIKTAEEHAEAMKELRKLFDLDPADGTPEANRLELLGYLVDDYESRVYFTDPVTPLEIIEFIMEERGLKQKDMIPYLGSASKVSEVLSGARPLSKSMIQRLHHDLGIPADLLIEPPETSRTTSNRSEHKRSPHARV